MTNINKHNDRELFRLIARGDQSAYATIYRKYTGLLYSFVLKILKSELWAEEIVHDIFLNLWANRAKLGSIDNPSAYLYRITANRTIDWIRKRELDLKIAYYSKNRVSASGNATEQLLDYRFSEGLIKEAINNLAPQCKLIYKLKYEAGLSYDEIARQLEISKNTVRNQLVKSVDSIRQHLQGKGAISVITMVLAFNPY